MMQDKLDQLLAYDPLAEAEQILGRGSEPAAWLGMALAQQRGAALRDELASRGDTMLTNQLSRYLSIVRDLGFEEVLCLPFTGRSWSDEPAPAEEFRIMAHRDGMLLAFDTYNTTAVNGAKVWYNWRCRDAEVGWRITSSGSYHRWDPETRSGTWVGDHDAREALRHKIQGLRDNGEFLARWERRPFMWLLHHMDTKQEGYDHHAINEARIALLPDWVQTMITPE